MAKKKQIFNILNWLKDAGFKALVILLLVTAGYSAYAAITWPGADPNPVSGVVGVFVGASSGPYDSGVGYAEANKLCSQEGKTSPSSILKGSHICTTAEMTNTYNHKPSLVSGLDGILWVNSSTPSNINPTTNDCKGWTDMGWSPYYGMVWDFDEDAAFIKPCAIATFAAIQPKFACCK